MKKFMREVISFMKMICKSDGSIPFYIILGAVSGGSPPFIGLFFSARILNQVIAREFDGCIQSVLWMAGLQLVVGMVERACREHMKVVYQSSEDKVTERMAAKAFELEYEEFEKQETLDAIHRTKISSIGNGGIADQAELVYNMCQNVVGIVWALVYVVGLVLKVEENGTHFVTSYWMTLIFLLSYIGLLVLQGCFGKKESELYAKMMADNDRANSVMGYFGQWSTNLKNGKDIRIFQMGNLIQWKLKHDYRDLTSVYLKTGTAGGKESAKRAFVGQAAAGLAYIYVGIKAVYGVIGVGDILLYTGAINQAAVQVTELARRIWSFQKMNGYLSTFDEFLQRPSMAYDGTLPIEKRDDAQYEFEFHDVSFSYPDTEVKVLDHVNLKFEIGKKMAIVGRNGAGKTTIIKLLCRLYEPTEGFITLNGIDIRKYNYKEYVKAFSVVFQDFELFSMPLDENIASGTEVDEERIWEVLDEVGLKERVKNMEDGIHSRLYHDNGEGIDISGGEAQRFAIARALYKDGPFVILDEPTAALDPIAEAEIYENFNQMIANKTAIYISHRMSSCKFCDDIVVLEHGKIAEYGTHEQLMAKNGIYANLYETQAQYYA